MEILLHTSELGDGVTVANASVDDFAELIAQTSHLGLVHYVVYDEREVRLVASSDPGIAAKIAQSDAPDNLLSLLSALRAAGASAS